MRIPQDWIMARDVRPDATLRLFCLPHAGSGAAGFYRWKRMLPAALHVCPVHLPGREARLAEAPVREFHAVVDAITTALLPLLDVPYALFGHSMGALLAYAVALELERKGQRPATCLIVSGREAAHQPLAHRMLNRLEDAAFLDALAARYGGDGAEMSLLDDPEVRALFLPILRADLAMVESYVYQATPPLRIPVLAVAGTNDASVGDAGLAAWAELTMGPFASRRLPGDHFFYRGEGQQELLAVITERLSTTP